MTLDQLLAQLDPDPSKRGQEFERLCAWYLRNAPEYRRKFRQLWLWSQWPGAWAADAGIDLVAEEHDGSLWAIQAKAYDPAYAIKKADVDSFLSESNRPQFSYRLLIATTDHLGPTARRTLDSQREPVGYLLRSQLELAPVAWPKSPNDLRPRRPARKKPFPHVREAVRATARAFEGGAGRGQLIMACGTGKTLAALWIAERLDSQRTLVLVPSLSLLAQTLREWSANASEPFDYLAVCSDETVAKQDEFVASAAELGLPVTTDPDRIAAFLRRRGRRVVFATYQSSPQVAAAYAGKTPHFDLAVADEAHRCTGRTSSEFATILDSEQIKAKRRLFMTATPRYYTPRVRREAGQLDVEVASMDDEAVFGPVLHRLTFGEGIERNLLSDYQVVVVGVDDETYRTYAERGEFVTRDGKKVTDARTLAGQIGLAKTMRKYGLHRVISFHGRVKAAREFCAEMLDVVAWMPSRARPAGPLWSEHVSGAMTSGHRDRLLLRFRNLAPNERGILSNARCLGEGVDVPSIDGVAFIDPRRSTLDIIQAVGRAIRKAPGKKVGTIVIPVFVEVDADPEEALDTSAFRHVWDVLKALRAHDEQLAEELDELRRRLGARRAPPGRPGRVKLDLPIAVGIEFATAFDARLVEQTTVSWEFWFGLLQRFVSEHGNALVPALYRTENGFRLGQWVNVQRTWYSEGRFPAERATRLNGVEGWVWDAREAKWVEGFDRLRRFATRNGHLRVPQTYADEDAYRLGAWVAWQRTLRRQGRQSDARARLLEALPGWIWGQDLDADWNLGLDHLRRYARINGDTLVPITYTVDGLNLGGWVRRQRWSYTRGDLTPERGRELARVPHWVWDPFAARWDRGFSALQEFVKREGHARVASKHLEPDGFGLGKWVNRQRSAYATDDLDPERARRLGAVRGWVWNERERQWETGFAHLCTFVGLNKHSGVPAKHRQDGFNLGTWLGHQRDRYRRGTLDPQKCARLEALPGWEWKAR